MLKILLVLALLRFVAYPLVQIYFDRQAFIKKKREYEKQYRTIKKTSLKPALKNN